VSDIIFNVFFTAGIIIIVFLIRGLLIKNNFLLDNVNFSSHKNITGHKKLILGPPLCGGVIIFISFFFDFSFYHLNIFIFFLLIIGVLSDLNVLISPKLRILFQTIVVFSFVITLDLRIVDLRFAYANLLLQITPISIIFTVFCILTLINGTNFIDGLNTLVLGYFILVLVAIISVALKFDLTLNENEFLFFIILAILFIYNFFEKIYLGDSGSYIVAITIAFFLLKFINKNQVVSPYFICLLLWYPAFENLFTILRRFSYKRKTYKADQQHLHQLLFFYFLKKFKKNNFLTNIFSALCINFFNLIIFTIASNYFNSTKIMVFLLCISILIYLYSYYRLKLVLK
jgi:UDP-N-acetylmuramyl pentapeptide phosphotransferase/UDP-N-acetylglucosamine-1-phosphate transferase